MLGILSVYGVLIVLIVGAYIVSQRLRGGRKQNFVEWIKSGWSRPGGAPMRIPEHRPVSHDAVVSSGTEVVTVLEDLYSEFYREIDALKNSVQAQMQSLEERHQEELRDLRKQLQDMKQHVQNDVSLLVQAEVENVATAILAQRVPTEPLPQATNQVAAIQEPVEGAIQGGGTQMNDGSTQPQEDLSAGPSTKVEMSVKSVMPSKVETPVDIKETTRQVPAKPHPNQTEESADVSPTLYFAILDELHAGGKPADVAAKLRVPLTVVNHVLEIMESPSFLSEQL